MPTRQRLESFRRFGWIGRVIFDHALWHVNRRSVALGTMIGVFWACVPIPASMLAAICSAALIRCNLPIAFGLVFVTNIFTLPPFLFFAYQFGALVLNQKALEVPESPTIDWFFNQLWLTLPPLLTGCILLGIFAGTISLFAVRFWWAWTVRRNWENRKSKIP